MTGVLTRVRPFAAGLAIVLSLAAASVRAEPEGGDAVSHFLAERGLIEPIGTDGSFARQVRERASDWTADLVISAMNFLGVRYKRGGQSVEQGFDCSGFTRHVFEASVGLVLPRRSNEQALSGELLAVGRNELKPGDLVFFNTLRRAFSHVGIYIGDGKFIHAPRTGGTVRVEDMRVAYWTQRYNGARRAAQPGDASVQPQPQPQPELAQAVLQSAAAAVSGDAPLSAPASPYPDH